jgi:Glycosyltransferase family 87
VPRFIRFLRDAEWVTSERVRVYAVVMIVVSAISIAWTLTGRGLDDPAGHAVGTDFVSFWTVSWAVLNGHQDAIYNSSALAALEQTVIPRSAAEFYAWQYPPIALLVVYPLALLPYLWALSVWLLTGAICYLSALWRIIPRWWTLWFGLAFPAVLLTITHGQSAFLTTALLTWGLLLLRDQPIIAGILLGALGFKPQLGLLVPIALIAGGIGGRL